MPDPKEIFKSKLISIDEALSKVKSGDCLIINMASGEAKEFSANLHKIADKVHDVNVVNCLPLCDYEYFINPAYNKSFMMESWFYGPPLRAVHKYKRTSYIPNHFYRAASARLFHRRCNIALCNVSPMDDHGYFSMGTSVASQKEIMAQADLVIAEVNPNVPRTFGDAIVHISEIDYLIDTDYPMTEVPNMPPSEKDRTIGRYIADLIEDGSTIQLGIGGIPNAVAAELMSKKDLGIHTEMLTDTMVDLAKAGVVTGKRKTLMPGKIVATFAMGTQKLYDFINDNPAVMMCNGSWVNDPAVIAQNYRQVSINTTMEVDLTGQCCSESVGHVQYSGTGGQSNTAVGAQGSYEGKSIIALYSDAHVRDPQTGERRRVSKIVPRLTYGAYVSLSRNDVDFVVTEYGVASLRGTSVKERVKRLIAIAHPDYRAELQEEADKLMLW